MRIITTHSLSFILAITMAATAIPATASATSAKADTSSTSMDLQTFFAPRPSLKTQLDFDAWDFILSETVLFMGPSTRLRSSQDSPQVGTRLNRSHTSPYKMEGNKVLYSLMTDEVKADMKAYAKELMDLGNRLDIPALPRNEQLAYWINLHNAVLVTTISDNYPGPSRRPSLIKPIDGSDAKLHDAHLIQMSGMQFSLRDIREKIVFPNWENADVPFAFHLGHLGSPSLANTAYTAKNLRQQLANNANEFVNSLRGYRDGRISPYLREISPWYYPEMSQKLDAYFRTRMRPEVYADFKSMGASKKNRDDLMIADMTGGFGVRGGMEKYAYVQSSTTGSGLGSTIDKFLKARQAKSDQLKQLDWFRHGTVTIEDSYAEDGALAEIK